MPNDEPATIYSIPPETLCDIFSFAYFNGDPSTLASASHVCRQWRDPAQRTLFERYDLATRVGRVGLPKWKTSPARARYPLRALSAPEDFLRKFLVATEPEGCRGVQSLRMAGRFLDWSALANQTLADLHHLHLDYECLRSMLSPVPPYHPTRPTFPFRLRELSLTLDLADRDIPLLLESIFACSHGTLKALSLAHRGRSTRSTDVVHDLSALPSFLLVAPALRHLHLDLSNYPVPVPLLNLFPRCTNLSTLSLFLSPASRREGALVEIGARLLCPPTIERLVVDKHLLVDKDFIADVVAFLRLPGLVRAKFVEFPTLDRKALGRSQGWALLEECEGRGILLGCRGEL